MQRRSLIQLALSSFFISTTTTSFGLHKAEMVIGAFEVGDVQSKIAMAILKEAYREANINLIFENFPLDRAMHLANDGVHDGFLSRKRGIDKQYTNLRIVPIPLYTMELAVFSVKHSFDVNGWDSLKPYTIGSVRGIQVIDENTSHMRRELAPNLHSAFKKMLKDRSDIVICNRASGLAVIKELQLNDVKLLSQNVAQFPLYHYVHKKNAFIIPKLSAALKKLTQDKTVDHISKSILEATPS